MNKNTYNTPEVQFLPVERDVITQSYTEMSDWKAPQISVKGSSAE